jgi:hypothetical protein
MSMLVAWAKALFTSNKGMNSREGICLCKSQIVTTSLYQYYCEYKVVL